MPDGADGMIEQARFAAGLLDPRLAIWLSPAFPVGAFAYSHGLEWAAHKGWARDCATLQAWIAGVVSDGALRNDLIFLGVAAEAMRGARHAELAGINDLALAMQPSAERRLETVQPGAAFLQAITAAWPAPGLSDAIQAVGAEIVYPVAVGLASEAHGIAIAPARLAYGLAFVGNLVSAAVRLSIVGQTDGQRIIASLWPAIRDVVDTIAFATIDDLGGSALRSDLASLAHETQYTRLFRS